MFTRKRSLFGLFGWLGVSFLTAIIGSIGSVQARTFYASLTQPDWAPPGYVFGPVWTALYLLMGIAAWLVWKHHGWKGARIALSLYLLQLFFNGLWSWLFFAWQQGALAFADIVILWLLIAATLISFWRIKPIAGMLFIPYLLWVTFAMILSYTIWQLNPQLLG